MPYDSCYSPLLDSLIVSLKKSPDLIVIINSWSTIPKKIFDERYSKKHLENDTNWVKLTYLRAYRIKYYLTKNCVTNCIFCNGFGFKIRLHEPKTIYAELCENAVQIILTKSDSIYCFKLEPNRPVILKNVYFNTGV